MALTVPILWFMSQAQAGAALVLFVFVALTDGVDGWLAKRNGWTSELGRMLDPLADKILLVFVFVYATWLGWIPVWLTAIAVARDVMIGLGSLIYRAWFGPLQGKPTRVSKVNTVLQILVLSFALLRAATGFPPWEVILAFSVIVAITTLWSAWDYIGRFVLRAWQLAGQPRG